MRKLFSLFFFGIVFLLTVALRAAAPAADPSDLGQELKFVRLSALSATDKVYFANISTTPALVFDLRGATTDEPSIAALVAAVRARPAGKGVCFILISTDTTPALLAALHPVPPGCITIGRPDGTCDPDIAVVTTAAAEQRARAALVAGTQLAALVAAPTDKPRHDEAELAKDHAEGKKTIFESDPIADTQPTLGQQKIQNSKPEPALVDPPVDDVLQRAVQLHRGLAALLSPVHL